MKKSTLLRKTAYLTLPQVSDGFVPPVNYDFKISVSLYEIDIKIYGFTGSSWELLHNSDGTIASFIAPVQHQKYYFESKSGAEHDVRVAFLSTEDEAGANIRTGVTPETRRFYDIEEIPVYNGSRDGAMLTVMSDGSLAWLLVNESFVVVDPNAPAINMVGLEESAGLTLHGNAQLNNGILSFDGTSGTYASLPHSTDYDRESGDLTIYMWMKANALPNNWNAGLVSKMGSGWSGYITAISTMVADVGGNMTTGGLQITTFGAPSPNNRAAPSGGVPLNVWHHVAFVMPAVGDYKMYFNGQEVHSYVPNNRATGTTGDLRLGGWEEAGYSGYFNGDIDGVFIQKSILTASEISDLHSVGRGNVIAGTFLEDISTVIARQSNKISSGIYADNQHGSTSGMSVLLKDDGILAYDPNTNETVNDEFTISWWMNLDASQAAANLGLAGIDVGQVNGVVRRFAFDLGGGSSLINPHFLSYTRNPKTTNNTGTGVSMAEVWTHVAIVIKNDSSNIVGSIYLNGSKLNKGFSYPLGTKVFPPSTHQEFKFGAGFQSKSVKGQFDSMQIADGVALTDSQVAAIAGQSDRQMSIETAATS